MVGWHLGLRGKSLLALGIACLVALVPAALMGWLAVANVREHFGLAYARNLTRLNREKILAPVSRELALSMRLAKSEVVRQWLLDENDARKRAQFFKEAESFRHDLHDHAWFVAVGSSGHYYFSDDRTPNATAPRLTLDSHKVKDSWFYATMGGAAPFNIHADFDDVLGVTGVWFNVVAKDGDRKIGVVGAALDLAHFLREFVVSDEPGVTPMILDRDGAIEFHPDKALIARYWTMDKAAAHRTAFDLLDGQADRAAFREALQGAERHPTTVTTAWVHLGGKEQLVAIGYIPELEWQVVSAVDLDAARLVDITWFRPAVVVVVLLLALLLAGFGFAVERLVLKPLRRLHVSASAIAAGHYHVALPAPTGDEIGELTAAFATMAQRVEQHTEDLESKVRERTAALEETNRQIVAAHRQIADSLDYARIIQDATLPAHQLEETLGAEHFVLWRPRDVVGGDFYVCQPDGDNCLLGVLDCAGHGVPGALMTMAGRAAVASAIHEAGPQSPAALLSRTDAAIRTTLASNRLAIATNMDAGLVYIDRGANRLLFAGARIGIFWTDGIEVEEVKGSHRALGERRRAGYRDHELPLVAGRTYHLATDGFFDQAGGDHGFGFGKSRFAAMLREHAHLPLSEQGAAFAAALARYQRGRPQRDDITMLSFRFS